MILSRNALILLSAGSGKRMGRKIPKMLITVMGKPLIYWTLKNLQSCSAVHSIILVVPKNYRKVFEKKIRHWPFTKIAAVVNGGKERTDSTRNALKQLPKKYQWVGIHDGARPFLTPKLIGRCFESAKKYGAAILGVPVTDTIKMIRGSKRSGRNSVPVVQQTIPRGKCWAAQTPQVFRRDIAEKIHLRAVSKRYTDDASIAESMGCQVRIVPSTYENMKVTMPWDLLMAEKLLRKKTR